MDKRNIIIFVTVIIFILLSIILTVVIVKSHHNKPKQVGAYTGCPDMPDPMFNPNCYIKKYCQDAPTNNPTIDLGCITARKYAPTTSD